MANFNRDKMQRQWASLTCKLATGLLEDFDDVATRCARAEHDYNWNEFIVDLFAAKLKGLADE